MTVILFVARETGIFLSGMLRIMFASKVRWVLRGVQHNPIFLGSNLHPSAAAKSFRFQSAPILIRSFSNVNEEAKKVVEAPKETQAAVSKQGASKVRSIAAGFTVGLVASALGSMAGLGGGFIIIPLLTTFGGMTQHQAASCSLASICVNAISGTCTYISQGLVDVPAAIAITATSMVMARYGSRWSHNFDSKSLKRYYAYLCLLVAPLIPLKNYIMQKRKEEEAMEKAQVVCDDLEAENLKLGYRDCLSMEAMKQSEAVEHCPLLLSLGLIAGTMSGFFGVGGGIIVSPSLCLFTQMVQKKIMGTSLVWSIG